MSRKSIWLFVVFLQGMSLSGIADPARPVMPLQPAGGMADVLRKSGGRFTAEVRAAYLDWAEVSVVDQLLKAGQGIPVSCLSEVNADPTLREAMFGSVFPPDPSILQNYAYLRSMLGPDFLRKYRSLVIGAAVAKRVMGVDRNNSAVAPRPVAADEADESDVQDEDAVADEPPSTGSALEKVIAEYMTRNHVSALDLYKDAAQKEALVQYLQERKTPPHLIAQTGKTKSYVTLLKGAMVELGQRPAHREAEPDIVTWLRYLAFVYEQKPPPLKLKKGTRAWPLFPMAEAPWPLLMPLARAMPLGEARYIWEKYLGEHGPERYHTYGPYRKWEGVIPRELQPSPWHWNAWPDRIVHGGVCVVMSGITVDTYGALCEPSVRATQPKHSNLISFRNHEGKWFAVIEQAFAGGPPVTYAGWPFQDVGSTAERFRRARNHKLLTGSEYQLGLSLGMNLGLQSYMDTRMAVGIFQALPAAEQKTLGLTMLRSVLDANPFNPEIWYLLAQQTVSAADGVALGQSALKRDPPAVSGAIASASTQPLESWEESESSRPIEKNLTEYWQTLARYVVRFAVLKHPVPSGENEVRAVYDLLQSTSGITADEKKPYLDRLGIQAPPPESHKRKKGK
jgi:hypothetical protein